MAKVLTMPNPNQLQTAMAHDAKLLYDEIVEKLPSDRKARLLAFMCGWCERDAHFFSGLRHALSSQYPELFDKVREQLQVVV